MGIPLEKKKKNIFSFKENVRQSKRNRTCIFPKSLYNKITD